MKLEKIVREKMEWVGKYAMKAECGNCLCCFDVAIRKAVTFEFWAKDKQCPNCDCTTLEPRGAGEWDKDKTKGDDTFFLQEGEK